MNNKISVFGLGKLGSAMLACFAHKGFDVIGVDINERTLTDLQKGSVYEDKVGYLIRKNENKIQFTTNPETAVLNSYASFIIVPTPSLPNGLFDTSFVESALKSIATVLKNKDEYHLVIITSTVLPGDTYRLSNIIEEISGKKMGIDFGLCYNPDFIALGKIVQDFLNPNLVLIGESDEDAGEFLEQIHKKVVDNNPKVYRMSFHNAELAKIALNSYCTMKISFANTIAEICENMLTGDANKVLEAIGEDTRVGHKYLRPGLAFSGPCVKPETLIQTDKGLIQINELNVGDKVLTHKGRFKNITKIYSREYDGDMVELIVGGFCAKPITTTPDHPVWSALRLSVGEKYRTINTTGEKRLGATKGFDKENFLPSKDLNHADSILMPQLNLDEIVPPIIEFKTHCLSKLPKLEITPELMKFFGFYISEGSSWKNEVKISLHKKEIYFAEELGNIILRNLGAKTKIKFRKGNGIELKFSAPHLVPFLKDTFGKIANEKRIPWEWLALPEKHLIELLRGIWYGDGSKSDGVFTFGTVSYDLFRFVQLSLLRFGIGFSTSVHSPRVDKNGTRHQQCYFVKIANGNFYEKMNYILPDLHIEPTKGSNLTWCRNSCVGFNIKAKNEIKYKGLVYNLEVEEDNSYVLEWGTVHNCFPRDCRAMEKVAENLGVYNTFCGKTDSINDYHKYTRIYNIIKDILDKNKENEIAVLGLSYKEDTPVIEESVPIAVIKKLIKEGVLVYVYDPVAMPSSKKELTDTVIYSNSIKDCIKDKKVCFVATPWKEFKILDEIQDLMLDNPIILDAWNILAESDNVIKIGKNPHGKNN